VSCAPKNLQPTNAAVSAEILNATACFPIAPGAGTGVVFCIHNIYCYPCKRQRHTVNQDRNRGCFSYLECDVLGNEIRRIHSKSC